MIENVSNNIMASIKLEKNQDNKQYIINNGIFEGICSIFFNNIIKPYSPCIYNIYSTYLIPEYDYNQLFDKNITIDDYIDDGVYDVLNPIIIMEKLETIPLDKLINNIYYVLYIILNNIYISQSLAKFVHGDLHIGNIMAKKYNKDTINIIYNDKIIKIHNKYNWIPIIVDFGFSSFEYKGYRYMSERDPITYSGNSYNEYSDLAKLFKSIGKKLLDTKHITILHEIEKIFLNNMTMVPRHYKLDDITFLNIYDFNEITVIINKLLNKLSYSIESTSTHIVNYIDPIKHLKYMTQNTNDIDLYNNKVLINSIFINNFTQYQHFYYNTLTTPQFNQQPISNQLNVHLIKVDNPLPLDYVFKNICCKQNTFDFMNNFNALLSINGTFFDLDTSNYFYKKNINGKKTISYRLSRYFNDYGSINITHNKIIIKQTNRQKILNHLNYYTDDSSFITGPLLYFNGKKTDIDLRIFEKNNFIYKYSCSNVNKSSFVSCNNIQPGELYHLANPNPRTIIATSQLYTYFIIIEGRTDKFKGATIEQLYDLLSTLNIENAICLDGGASVSMLFRYNNNIYSALKYKYRKSIANVIGIIPK